MERVGLIAGNGSFPVIFARNARAEGVEVVAVAHEGETDAALGDCVDAIAWVKVGQIEPIIRTFHARGVTRAVMAGGIGKAALMGHFEPDERGRRLLARLETWSDDAVLRGLAKELKDARIEVVESTLFLKAILTRRGALTPSEPDEAQWRDIRYGVSVARAIGTWDVGQTVVVKSGVVLAVEAIEGTDETLRRGGRLAQRDAVAVKISKPGQDLRFDVPAVGLKTVSVCRDARIAVLALEAGRTLILEREHFLDAAAGTNLAVVGIDAGDD